MKTLLFLVCNLTLLTASSQQISKEQNLNLAIGASKHTTGDLLGIAFTTEYGKFFRKRLSWNIGLTGTINSSDFGLEYTSPSGREVDAAYRYTTAGMQFNLHMGFAVVNNKANLLQLRLGPVFRYESSSVPNMVRDLYPPVTGLPVPVTLIEHYEPQIIYSIGGSLQLRYDYILPSSYTVGILGGFQAATNGDNIMQLCFSIGRRF